MINCVKKWLGKRHGISRNKGRLISLSPRDSLLDEKHKAYYGRLKNALDDKKVNNIALTGHYGCGKSSLLQTFQKHFGENHRFLNISLATFGALKDGEASKGSNLSHLVEHSILQQIFYQVPKQTIPRSRFKRISKPGSFIPWIGFLLWIFCLTSLLALFRPEFLKRSEIIYEVIEGLSRTGTLVVSIFSLAAILLPMGLLFQKARYLTLRKLNIKSCEIEIDEEKKSLSIK